MPPNTKKCYKCGRKLKESDDCICPCPTPAPEKEKCVMLIPNFNEDGTEKDIDYWFTCLKEMPCPDHTPTPTTEKCEGICKHCPYYVNECPKDHEQNGGGNLPPTPAVEDWEKDFDKEFGEHHCVYNGDYKSFIRSLRESDRKRIIEEIENKMGELKSPQFPNTLGEANRKLGTELTDWNAVVMCRRVAINTLSDILTFITNLK